MDTYRMVSISDDDVVIGAYEYAKMIDRIYDLEMETVRLRGEGKRGHDTVKRVKRHVSQELENAERERRHFHKAVAEWVIEELTP